MNAVLGGLLYLLALILFFRLFGKYLGGRIFNPEFEGEERKIVKGKYLKRNFK